MRADEDKNPRQPGRWQRLWRWPKSKYLLWIPAGGFVMLIAGAVLLGSFNYTMEVTNTMEFCTSCHEMEAFVYEEYKQTAHYNNPSGVRPICSDCHVPKDWFAKVMRKAKAGMIEVPSWLMGKIDTPEKFEAHRREMAESVWAGMRANDSKACRNCHSYEAMALDKQDRYARRKHSADYLEATGKTCIDCHQGVAHKLPEIELDEG